MKIILALIVCFLSGNICFSQISNGQNTQSNYRIRAKKKTEEMNGILNLSSIQLDSLSVINRDFYDALQKVEYRNIDISKRAEYLKEIEKIWLSRIKKNISEGQFKKYSDNVDDQKKHWQQKQDSVMLHHH